LLFEVPEWLGKVYIVVLGLLIGSFLNVVVVRVPLNQSIIRPRSRCVKCQRNLNWWENIPVFSYLFLKGKCKGCQSEISIRYPVIELLTALLFLAAQTRFGWSIALVVRDLPFLALLLAITFIDLEHRIIPDSMSLGGLVLGLATCWMVAVPTWQESLIGAAVGFLSFFSLSWLYHRFTGRVGLGGGDIKLLAMLGAFIGPAGVFATILISSIFGSIFGIGWALLGKKSDLMKLSIPFGPFLVFGAMYYYLLGDILWFQFMTPM
jgi:leader peptidase (prepilin peptidase)/N-methyltransferase